jgi:hypothetical protein
MNEAPAIVDVGPTLLKLYGLDLPMNLDGGPWTFADSGALHSVSDEVG